MRLCENMDNTIQCEQGRASQQEYRRYKLMKIKDQRFDRKYGLTWTSPDASGCSTRTKQELIVQSLSFPKVFSGNLNFDYSINIKILPNAAFRFPD